MNFLWTLLAAFIPRRDCPFDERRSWDIQRTWERHQLAYRNAERVIEAKRAEIEARRGSR